MQSMPPDFVFGGLMTPLGRSALVFVLGIALAQENNAPPTVNDLLERWTDAMGGREKIEHITSIYRAGVTTEDGLKGTIEDWVTATGRHKQIRAREGLDTTLAVFDGDHGWVRDWNGKVHALAGADVKNELSETLQASYSYLKRSGAPQWSLLGEDETRESYVLQLVPPRGRAISFYLNKATGLPAKLQRANGDNTLTVYYDDWRSVGGIGGVKLPFRIRRNTGDPRADVGISLATIRLNVALPKGTFRKPQDTARDSRFTSGGRAASIPFTLASNFILVQVQVNRSRPLWFLLDTGASITVINKDRAQELGLALHGDLALGTSGGSTGFSITKGVSFSVPGAEVADQTVGAISLSAFEAGFGLPIGGILGYDFISRFVVELDFEAKRVNLYDPQNYRYRGPGEAIPLTLEDENNPFVQAEIGLPDGRTIAGTFEIDTGETKALFLNTPFVKSHQLLESARDSQATTGSRASEKQFFAGLSAGGQVERLKMGRFVVEKVPAGLSLEGSGFVSNADYAGLIGNAILSRFKVILDYSRLRMILEPTARLKEPFASRRDKP